jgi:uncharacterized protein (TIGR02118 family)
VFKAIILLARREDMTRDEFKAWWLDEHAPMARQLPELRRAVFNLVTTEGAEFDGITELWFDSRRSFEEAYASEIGKGVAADSIAHVARRERLFVLENELPVG